MKKFDFKKELKHLYTTSSKEILIVDVPKLNFLMIDGQGDPNTSPLFQKTVELLYNLSYTLKFMLKKEDLAIDYIVPPLEGLWWADDMSKFITKEKEAWKWTMMIMQPDFINKKMFFEALDRIKKKKESSLLSQVRFESFKEGLCIQTLHIGPYATEFETIEKMHQFARENDFVLRGKHHEIYLSDPRRCAPEKLKTIIRQPIAKSKEC